MKLLVFEIGDRVWQPISFTVSILGPSINYVSMNKEEGGSIMLMDAHVKYVVGQSEMLT